MMHSMRFEKDTGCPSPLDGSMVADDAKRQMANQVRRGWAWLPGVATHFVIPCSPDAKSLPPGAAAMTSTSPSTINAAAAQNGIVAVT